MQSKVCVESKSLDVPEYDVTILRNTKKFKGGGGYYR